MVSQANVSFLNESPTRILARHVFRCWFFGICHVQLNYVLDAHVSIGLPGTLGVINSGCRRRWPPARVGSQSGRREHDDRRTVCECCTCINFMFRECNNTFVACIYYNVKYLENTSTLCFSYFIGDSRALTASAMRFDTKMTSGMGHLSPYNCGYIYVFKLLGNVSHFFIYNYLQLSKYLTRSNLNLHSSPCPFKLTLPLQHCHISLTLVGPTASQSVILDQTDGPAHTVPRCATAVGWLTHHYCDITHSSTSHKMICRVSITWPL